MHRRAAASVGLVAVFACVAILGHVSMPQIAPNFWCCVVGREGLEGKEGRGGKQGMRGRVGGDGGCRGGGGDAPFSNV
jgi:hypothetical protein